jgi:hypothetical protein
VIFGTEIFWHITWVIFWHITWTIRQLVTISIIMILMWSFGRVICLSDLGNILAYYLNKITLLYKYLIIEEIIAETGIKYLPLISLSLSVLVCSLYLLTKVSILYWYNELDMTVCLPEEGSHLSVILSFKGRQLIMSPATLGDMFYSTEHSY